MSRPSKNPPRHPLAEIQRLLLQAQQALADLEDATNSKHQDELPPSADLNKQAEEAGFLTVDQVAGEFQLCRSTVYALLNAGELRYVQVGRRRRIHRSELNRYINRGPHAA